VVRKEEDGVRRSNGSDTMVDAERVSVIGVWVVFVFV